MVGSSPPGYGPMDTPDVDIAPNRASKPSRIRSGALGLLLVLLMAGFCLLAVSMLRTMRRETWHDAVLTSQNLMKAQAEELDRTLAIYDASLRSASAALTDPALQGVSPRIMRLAIFDHLQPSPDLGPVRILNAAGAVLYDSATPSPGAASPAEQRALAVHQLGRGTDAMVSPPYRTISGAHVITVSHRIATPDGQLFGIVVGTIRLHLFFEQLRDLSLGGHDIVGLYSTSGMTLALLPDERFVGRSIAGGTHLRQFLGQSAGTFVAVSRFDGVRRVYSFRHVAGWPLILNIGLSTEDLYRSWHQRAVITGLLLGVMFAFTLLLLWLLRRDVRVRLVSARSLAASEARYRVLAESSPDLIVRVDRNMIRTYVSPSCRQFGYEPSELLGLPGSGLIHDEDLAAARVLLLRTTEEQVGGEFECRLLHKSGKYTWVEAHVSPLEDDGYLLVIRDIDRRKQDEQRREVSREALAQLAATDGLTRLANRRVFDEQLSRAWEDASRGSRPLSLLMLDVDHFKAYNDHYGHQAGDAVLIEVAQRASRNVKRAGDIAARYGGEEFAVLLPATDIYGAIEVAEAIRTAVSEAELAHAGSPLGRLTVSIGVATAMPSLGIGTPEGLVKAADDELYRVKQNGRNRISARAIVVELVPVSVSVPGAQDADAPLAA